MEDGKKRSRLIKPSQQRQPAKLEEIIEAIENIKLDRSVKFGQWIRKEREDKNLKTGEAARLAGISRVHWSRVEAGDTGVKDITILLIARVLGYTSKKDIYEVFRKAGRLLTQDQSFELPIALQHFTELAPEIQRDIARIVEREWEHEQLKRKERGRK